MQGLTQPPRDGLSADAVRSLLSSGPWVQVDQGCDLLDTNNAFVEEISADENGMVAGGEVTHDNDAGTGQIFGKCQLKLGSAYAWGRDRFRPWVLLSDGTTTARVNLGVYVLTTPDAPSGESPVTYDVQGYDLTTILQDKVGDTYVCAAFDATGAPTGLTYFAALRQVLTASGIGAGLLLDGTGQNTVMPYTMVWCLYDGGPDWLTICNDLLSAVGYERLWADENGTLRSGPVMEVATAPVGWAFDGDDTTAGIVAPGWVRSEDLWSAPNSWQFIRTNMTTTPTEGAGIYTPAPNQSDGPSSIDSIGRTRPKVVFLDAADQASLVAQGDQIMAQDKGAGTQVKFSTFLPTAGHNDVVTFAGGGRLDKLPVASWTTNLDGSPGAWVAGGVTRPDPVPLQASALATVTQASPLRIVVDGASADSPANSLDGAAYVVGDRVSTTVRNPVQPVVNGKETS